MKGAPGTPASLPRPCCPRQKDTLRQFECIRRITAEQVKDVIRRILGLPDGNGQDTEHSLEPSDDADERRT